jgi:hypothetical protein
VCVRDHTLYVVNDFQGLEIYDIADPSSPEMLGYYWDSYTFTHSIFIEGELAYTADYEDGFEILNISDSSNPELVGRYTSGAGVTAGSTDAFKVGNLGYLASQNLGLEIINCSNPTNLSKIGSYYEGERVIRVYAIDELVFLSEAHNGFKILEIHDNNYTELYHFYDSVSYQDFFVHEDILYTTDTLFGFKVFDISNPSQIVQIGEEELGRSHGFVIQEENDKLLAYVTTWESGLQILDVGDPSDITVIVQYNDGGEDIKVEVNNSYVYVAEFSSGLEILEFSYVEDQSSAVPCFEGSSFLLNSLILLILVRKLFKTSV